jgi:hypothetical protein
MALWNRFESHARHRSVRWAALAVTVALCGVSEAAEIDLHPGVRTWGVVAYRNAEQSRHVTPIAVGEESPCGEVA